MKLETRENSAPKISVIVPIYKVEKYLCQCIDSILAQTLQDIEVILVDEGDLDACRAIIDMYEFGAKKDSRVKSIHEKNGGYGASVNKGMDIATGEYISIIEADDFIAPEMYEEMYNYAKKLDADVVKTPYYEYRDKTKFSKESRVICEYADIMRNTTPMNKTFSVQEYPKLMGVHASLWSGIYKKSYMKEKNIRFIEAKGGAYVDVGFRIDTLINTDKVAWLDRPFYHYRLTSEGSTTNNYDLNAMIIRWKEAHDKFQNCPEIYKKVGPELIWDEYVNTAGCLFNDYQVTEANLIAIRDNYKTIPDEVINNSPTLTKFMKKVILDIKHKNNSVKHYKKMNFKAWYRSEIKIKKNVTMIHVFRYMKHNIIRNIFHVGGIYVIDFCVGKVGVKKANLNNVSVL